ncbi:MAG: hypothetical protein KDH09_13905 [Chrysiogenetes bacterium]|nr:hypothetical protein [Chrysiogenetes bacterium]
MKALQIGAFLLGAALAYGQMDDALAGTQSPAGQALEIRRAAEVQDRRGEIIERTLGSVGVTYEAGKGGVPVWIELAGRKMPVRRVRVSPIGESTEHEVAITTAQGTLLLREP